MLSIIKILSIETIIFIFWMCETISSNFIKEDL